MVIAADIKKLVSAYLNGQDLESFGSQFAELFYDIEKTGDQSAITLAYEIESKLAAVTSGLDSEDELKNAMHGYVPSYRCIQDVFLLAGEQSIATPQMVVPVACPVESVRGYTKLAMEFGLTTDPRDRLQSSTNPVPIPQTIVA